MGDVYIFILVCVFIFWRAELPSLRQTFPELLPQLCPLSLSSCAPFPCPAQHPRNFPACRGISRGSLCHSSGKGKGSPEQAESRRDVSLSISKCSEMFNCAPKQAEQWPSGILGCARGWCSRAPMPASKASTWEPDYFCSELKLKHLQNSWHACSLKTYTLGVFLSVWGLHISFPNQKKKSY